MEDRIQLTLTDGVADVRLVRVDKMNALDDAMFQALIDMGERLKSEPGVRAIVLSGEGRAFCAGLDMGNFARMAAPPANANATGNSLVTANQVGPGARHGGSGAHEAAGAR